MTTYYHAIWGPSSIWPNGYQYGAPFETFKRVFPAKVEALGPPFLLWTSEVDARKAEPSSAVPDNAKVLRALRRLVHTDKLLNLEQAWALCDLFGFPRSEVTEFAPPLRVSE